MKILIVSEFFPTSKDLNFSGGVEARNFFIAKNLAGRHKITVLTSRLIGTKKKEIINNFQIIRVGRPSRYFATTGNLIKRFLFVINCIKESKVLDADVVEGTNFITHTIAFLIGKDKKIPTVAWYPDVWIGSWIKNAGILGLVGELHERINLNLKFDAFIAISNITRKKLTSYINKKIHVIPCGVDLKEFKVDSKKNTKEIICISRLAPYKNIKELILAFALLFQKNKELRLVIIGRGPEEKKLKELVRNIKLEKHIDFKSNLKRKELINDLTKAGVFCLPSKVEGFGISVIEAAAARTPYVISNIPVFKEITKNFTGGLSYDVGDINNLKDKMEMLISDRALYIQKKKECKKLAKIYNWENIAKQTEKIYKLNL